MKYRDPISRIVGTYEKRPTIPEVWHNIRRKLKSCWQAALWITQAQSEYDSASTWCLRLMWQWTLRPQSNSASSGERHFSRPSCRWKPVVPAKSKKSISSHWTTTSIVSRVKNLPGTNWFSVVDTSLLASQKKQTLVRWYSVVDSWFGAVSKRKTRLFREYIYIRKTIRGSLNCLPAAN